MPFATVGGLRMYYEWHGPETAPPLVLIMGLGGDTTAWAFQLGAFVSRWRCLCLDNRGAGRTDASAPPYSTLQMAGDVLGLLDALGVERAHVLGVSMGGAVAQEAALLAPARVLSLQLHCTWPGPDPHFAAMVRSLRRVRVGLDRESFVRAFMPWLFTAGCYAERPEFVELVLQHGLAHPNPQSLPGYLGQVEAVLGHDARGRLAGVSCPTLITVGTEDILTPPRFARELAGLVPGARLEFLPGGHGYFWEVPDALNAACLAFLEEVGGSRR